MLFRAFLRLHNRKIALMQNIISLLDINNDLKILLNFGLQVAVNESHGEHIVRLSQIELHDFLLHTDIIKLVVAVLESFRGQLD
jgi:hypothetical protein